jgi:hypothetical protein
MLNKDLVESVLNSDLGGATWDIRDNYKSVNLNGGYMVGTVGHKYPVCATKSGKYIKDSDMDKMLNDFNFVDSGILKDNVYLGAWINDGYLYIDLSLHVLNLDDALRIGKLFNQIAIWDNDNKKEIKL